MDLLQQLDHPHYLLLKFFFTFQILGGVGVAAILLTASLSNQVRRHIVWMSFNLTWIISVVSYSLLLISGQQTGPQPGSGLCLAQAVLIYGAPVLTSQSMLALVLQLWSTLYLTASTESTSTYPIGTVSYIVFPYIIYLMVVLESLAIGMANPDTVQRAGSDIYCIIDDGVPGRISSVVVVLTEIVSMGFEAHIGVILYRNWRAFRNSGSNSSVTMFIRVGVFTVLGMVTIAASLVLLSHASSVVPNVFIAIMPMAAFVVFGSQMDILHVWIFWKKPTPETACSSPAAPASLSSTLSSLTEKSSYLP